VDALAVSQHLNQAAVCTPGCAPHCRIVAAREARPITTTKQLVEAIGQTQLWSSSSGRRKGARGGIHPATRTFQALRIAVNDELGRLQQVRQRYGCHHTFSVSHCPTVRHTARLTPPPALSGAA
jgi:hypothetical protein